ncbi:hypothetical protein [Streptomyces antimicrobicus]|uniref:Uncharacterized protein n=1 Tax=Streptomyces antimicrobicus TaxID=2883108 RepID=A0ABS8BB46_9ACTN|nr:hypothetical protein [Streptomyces antimicrobicus]MCB5181756.1 hypothetical protein [Streptomyces antimicrobicus]
MDPQNRALAVPPVTAVPSPLSGAADGPAPTDHTITTTERGSFCLAVCSCGWQGPARRSRDLARKDAERHRAG